MITIKSHGFKFSRPDANFVFDVSYFKNPWRDEDIKNEEDPKKRRMKIINFMTLQPGVADFVTKVAGLIEILHKRFPYENMQIAFCCSAGEYRSPAIVELISDVLTSYAVPHEVEQSVNAKL